MIFNQKYTISFRTLLSSRHYAVWSLSGCRGPGRSFQFRSVFFRNFARRLANIIITPIITLCKNKNELKIIVFNIKIYKYSCILCIDLCSIAIGADSIGTTEEFGRNSFFYTIKYVRCMKTLFALLEFLT